MSKKQVLILTNALFVLFIVLVTFSLFFDTPRMYAEEHLGDNKITTGFIYFLIVLVTTIFAPFAGLPLAPAVSIVVGPFLTSVYGVLGWTAGAIIAFLIARHLARPLLCRIIDVKKAEIYETYIPEKHIFLWLVFLRVVIPIDILSYAIGLTKRVRFPVYVISTFIGVIPFSFIWTYGGYAFLEQDYVALSIFGGVGLLLFLSSLVYYRTQKRKRYISKNEIY